jgi:16S rRNA (guanine527-N7)-methyltransferase
VFHVEHAGNLADYLTQASEAVSIPISPQQSTEFVRLAHVLQEWNRTINLTAISEPREVAVKHFIDSIAPLRFGLFAEKEIILDVGAGAGFPSIPLKIMRPDLRPVLLEPNSKKVSFLLYAVGTLQLKGVRVVNQTVEEFSGTIADRFDHVVVRALSLDTVGRYAANLLTADGALLAYRSEEIGAGDIPPGLCLRKQWSYELPFGYGSRTLIALGIAHSDVPRGTRGWS